VAALPPDLPRRNIGQGWEVRPLTLLPKSEGKAFERLRKSLGTNIGQGFSRAVKRLA
jgi:hypothetical protein